MEKINELPEPPRYVMSGLAKEAMEVRHEFAAFILDRYGVTDHAELRTRIDSLLIMFDQLVAPPKEQGAEPVAWMTEDGKEFVENWVREEWVKDNGPTAQFFIPRYPTPLYRHPQPLPTPTSRERAMEEAVEEVIKAYRGFHEAIEQHTGKPYPWDPMVSAIEKWASAKSTK